MTWGTPKKPKEAPAMRRPDLEHSLCQAIAQKLQVALKYDDDLQDRLFDPYAVYETSTGKICVAGTQIKNPAKPFDGPVAHNFEIGKIRSLRITQTVFKLDPRFDRHDSKFKNGIICSV